MYVLSWDEAAAAGPVAAGGKGWNLGRLHRYGMPVPGGFVVGAQAYRDFLATLSLANGADGDSVRAAIAASPLPPSLIDEVTAAFVHHGLATQPVAVRSSATAEDAPGTSFAGIHQSFLNVTGTGAVLVALKGCYASLWTPQAIAYRRRFELSDESVAAAVVIIAMVDAVSAGVGFTCDPKTGRLDRFALSATVGLGEALVSGVVEPDEYLVDIFRYPPQVESRRIGRKAHRTVTLRSGTTLAPTPSAEAQRPALTEQQVAELALLMGRIHDSLGEMEQPQDIEWAHDGRQFWLLQARPVTKLPPPTFPAIADQPVVWSNANLKDVLPGVQSAMGWSFARTNIDRLLRTPLRQAGYPYAGGMTWIRLFEGRAYFNLSAMQWAFYDAFNVRPDEFNRIIGGHQPEITLPPRRLGQRLRQALGRARLVSSTVASLQTSGRLYLKYTLWAEKAEGLDYDRMTPAEWLACCVENQRVAESFMPIFQSSNGAAGGIHDELIKALTPAFGDRATGLVNAMLAGSGGITSAEQGDRLVAVAALALGEPSARAWFTSTTDDGADAGARWQPLQWAARLAGTQTKTAFEAYLKDYGHRGVYEVEVMNPRWREDPTYLLDSIRSMVMAGRTGATDDRRAKREAARREVFARLGWGPAGLQVRYFLRQAARAAAMREEGKSILVRIVAVSRLIALAVGHHLAARGLLESPADIFHFSWLDMEAYLTGRTNGQEFRTLVSDRKARREEHLRLQPPDLILGDQPVRKAPPPEARGPVLSGAGVAAGRAAGTARVIRHPDEGHRLQPGDVLVAPSTDPAWTPLFLRASAVVMEVGGSLSHGAIVAREYGLPAVVNIPGLLELIRDGERLVVDGDRGKVYRQT